MGTQYQINAADAEWSIDTPQPVGRVIHNYEVAPTHADFAFETEEAGITWDGGPSLFTADVHNPGDEGDVGLRWARTYTDFATEANATRAHLIASNEEAGGVTPVTFQDQAANVRSIDWFVLHHGNDRVILNLNASISNDSEDDYRVAFRERGTPNVWVYEVSTDANNQDPYEMPANQDDLTAIVEVITNGGSIRNCYLR